MIKSNWKLSLSFLNFFKQLLIAHWRSLLILFIGVYLPLQVFGLLAVEVWEDKGGFPWDISILLAVHSIAKVQLNVFAATLTRLGSFWTVFPIVSAIALVKCGRIDKLTPIAQASEIIHPAKISLGK